MSDNKSTAYQQQLKALRTTSSMDAVMAQFQSIMGATASSIAASSMFNGKSKPPTSWSDVDDTTTPTASVSGKTGISDTKTDTKTSTPKKPGKRTRPAGAGDANGTRTAAESAHSVQVKQRIRKALDDRDAYHMSGTCDGPASDNHICGFVKLGEPHSIDLASKMHPSALKLIRPKNSTQPVVLKVQLYQRTAKHYHEEVIPYVDEATVFGLTQFTLSPEEYSPAYFTTVTHRVFMHIDEIKHAVFGCTLLDFIYSLRSMPEFSKKAYAVHIADETEPTVLLKKEGLVALVTELTALLAPYSTSAKHAESKKPIPDAIDLAASGIVAVPNSKTATAPAAAVTAVVSTTPNVPATTIPSKPSTVEAAPSSASIKPDAISAPPPPKSAVNRNTQQSSVVIENDIIEEDADEDAPPSPKRVKSTPLPSKSAAAPPVVKSSTAASTVTTTATPVATSAVAAAPLKIDKEELRYDEATMFD